MLCVVNCKRNGYCYLSQVVEVTLSVLSTCNMFWVFVESQDQVVEVTLICDCQL